MIILITCIVIKKERASWGIIVVKIKNFMKTKPAKDEKHNKAIAFSLYRDNVYSSLSLPFT